MADDTWQMTCITMTVIHTAAAATHMAAGNTHYGGQQRKNGSGFTTRTRAGDDTDMSIGHTSVTYSNMHSHDDNTYSPDDNMPSCGSNTLLRLLVGLSARMWD